MLSPIIIDNILDIFFSNIQSLITDYKLEDPLGASDHVRIITDISIPLCNDNRPISISNNHHPTIIWNADSIVQAQ